MGTGIFFEVTPADRLCLEVVVRDRNTAQKHVWRAEIVLLSGDSVERLLRDKTRPSRIPRFRSTATEHVVALTLTEPPAETTHWTAAMMARETGISESSVRRVWRAHGLQPRRVRQFKLSYDPDFVSKLRDLVGLCVDPPAHAVVLPVDEKS